MSRFDGRVAIVAVATRSGLEESAHHGAGAALDASGELVATIGDPDLVVYPRSCLKPLQAHAMVTLGLDVPDEQLAVACASHDGSPQHLAVVEQMLSDHGLGVEDLRNTPSRPYDAAARSAARLAGIEPSSLQQNCSGKHAAMLVTCRINDWPTADYWRLDHPLQVAITAELSALGCAVSHVGVDGCGAPTHAISLRHLSAAFARIAGSDVSSNGIDGRVARAMCEHPEMVAGPTRDVTRWMRAVPGLIAKDGAAGVFAAATDDGRAVAFKIADGSNEARRAVVPAALRAAAIEPGAGTGTPTDAPADEQVLVLGHGRPVGAFVPTEWTPCSS